MQRKFKMHENGKKWDAGGADNKCGVQKINKRGLGLRETNRVMG